MSRSYGGGGIVSMTRLLLFAVLAAVMACRGRTSIVEKTEPDWIGVAMKRVRCEQAIHETTHYYAVPETNPDTFGGNTMVVDTSYWSANELREHGLSASNYRLSSIGNKVIGR